MLLLNETDRSRLVKKTVWLLFAVAINALEFFIPRLPFFPWLKPGLANVVTILWIIEYGAVDAVVFSLLRTWIVGFYFGFSFLTLSLAMSGGVVAAIAMGTAWNLLGKNRLLGAVGLGIVGALFHNLGQLLAVYFLMATNTRLFYQVPIMLSASVIFGGIVGWLAPVVYRFLDADNSLPDSNKQPEIPTFFAPVKHFFFSGLLLTWCIGIVFFDSIWALCVSAIGAALIVQIRHSGSLKAFFRPLSAFWALFVFIGCIDLFFSYGTRIEHLPALTYEGVDATVKQWLRLWTWLQISGILSLFSFHSVMLIILSRIFPGHRESIFAGVLALEYFPGIAEDSKVYVKNRIRLFFGKSGTKSRKSGNDPQKKHGGVNDVAKGLYTLVVSRIDNKS
jgi:heptaprenyl diphosphate synthase